MQATVRPGSASRPCFTHPHPQEITPKEGLPQSLRDAGAAAIVMHSLFEEHL